jgi:hypothetical protein
MKIKKIIFAMIIFISSSLSQANDNEMYNFNHINENVKFFKIFNSIIDGDPTTELWYDVSLILDGKCKPISIGLTIYNLDKKIKPNSKNDKVSMKVGNRLINNSINTLIENMIFIFDVPSNLPYSLNLANEINITADFRGSDIKIPFNFNISEQNKKQLITDIRNCRP